MEDSKYSEEPVIEGGFAYYGCYPQTHINDQNIIASLNAIPNADKKGWLPFDDKYYVKKLIDFPNYNPGANALLEEGDEIHSKWKYADGSTIVFGNADWFVCEPIKWRILKEEDGFMCLLSDMIMDAHQFDAKSNSSNLL